MARTDQRVLGSEAVLTSLAADNVSRLISVGLEDGVGVDTINDVIKVRTTLTNFTATADAQIKSGVGFVGSVDVGGIAAVPTAGLLTLYDNTAESGDIIRQAWITATTEPFTWHINATFAIGLRVSFDGTLVNVRVSGGYS